MLMKLLMATAVSTIISAMSLTSAYAQSCGDLFAEPHYALHQNEFIVIEMQRGFGEKILTRGRLSGLSQKNGRALYELTTDLGIKNFDSAAVFSRVPVRQVRAVVMRMNAISQLTFESPVTVIAARNDPKAPPPAEGETPVQEYVGLVGYDLVRVLQILP